MPGPDFGDQMSTHVLIDGFNNQLRTALSTELSRGVDDMRFNCLDRDVQLASYGLIAETQSNQGNHLDLPIGERLYQRRKFGPRSL